MMYTARRADPTSSQPLRGRARPTSLVLSLVASMARKSRIPRPPGKQGAAPVAAVHWGETSTHSPTLPKGREKMPSFRSAFATAVASSAPYPPLFFGRSSTASTVLMTVTLSTPSILRACALSCFLWCQRTSEQLRHDTMGRKSHFIPGRAAAKTATDPSGLHSPSLHCLPRPGPIELSQGTQRTTTSVSPTSDPRQSHRDISTAILSSQMSCMCPDATQEHTSRPATQPPPPLTEG